MVSLIGIFYVYQSAFIARRKKECSIYGKNVACLKGSFHVHGKDGFAETSKNSASYTSENNFVGPSK